MLREGPPAFLEERIGQEEMAPSHSSTPRLRRVMAWVLVSGLSFPGPVVAADAGSLEQGRGAYEAGDWDQVIAILTPSVKPPRPRKAPAGTREIRLESHLLLARALLLRYQYEKLDAVRAEFLEVLKLRPDHHLDPVFTPVAVVNLFDQVRRENEGLLARFPVSAEATVPGVPYPVGTLWDARAAPLWALPPGVGQFLNGEPAKGVVFIAVETGLAAATAATWIHLNESNQGSLTPDEREALVLERGVNHALVVAFAATLVVGMVDGLLSRSRAARRKVPLPNPDLPMRGVPTVPKPEAKVPEASAP